MKPSACKRDRDRGQDVAVVVDKRDRYRHCNSPPAFRLPCQRALAKGASPRYPLTRQPRLRYAPGMNAQAPSPGRRRHATRGYHVAQQVPSFDLAYQGIDTDATLHWNLGTGRWSSRRCSAARACSPRTARWSSRPASTPAARPRTSSSSATPRPKPLSGGTINESMTPEHFAALKADFLAALGEQGRSCSSRTCSAARSPSTACACA